MRIVLANLKFNINASIASLTLCLVMSVVSGCSSATYRPESDASVHGGAHKHIVFERNFFKANVPGTTTYINQYSKSQRLFISRSFSRLDDHSSEMYPIFEDYNVPRELFAIAIVESGLNPTAKSPMGAMGMWQFMERTAEAYGMSVTYFSDERKNVKKSTLGAAKYLIDLYDQFGDWPLAIAAYNAGPGTVNNAIRKAGTRDLAVLMRTPHFRNETKQYVSKVYAVMNIMNRPEQYGFSLQSKEKTYSSWWNPFR